MIVRSAAFGVRSHRSTKRHWPVIKQLCQYARDFYARDWMLGTSGNLSIKLEHAPLRIALTASGRDKGRLLPSDILTVDQHGDVIATRRTDPTAVPSAEARIHLALYQQLPDCGAVFHVHTLNATTLTSRVVDDQQAHAFRVEKLEMLKGFHLWEQDPVVALPVFPNWSDIGRIADDVQRYYRTPRALPVFLLAHHGFTAWGRTAQEAAKHVELAEFLCRYLWVTGAQPTPLEMR